MCHGRLNVYCYSQTHPLKSRVQQVIINGVKSSTDVCNTHNRYMYDQGTLEEYMHCHRPEASSRYRSARRMPGSHQVTLTILGYFGCTNRAPKIAKYSHGDSV